MATDERLANTAAELDKALDAARDLQAGCCQPLRSPRMERLQTTLTRAQDRLAGLGQSPDTARSLIAYIEDAGAQLGSLQVACCAPARIPLYATALESLGRAQRLLTLTYDLEH